MFSIYHFIWLLICTVGIVGCLLLIKKRNIPLKSVLTAAVVVSIFSESTKILSAIQIVPLSDGSGMVPYLELNHLPLHLCSIQILLIFYTRFASPESRFRRILLGFMYPTCFLGAVSALLMPSIFSTTIQVSQAFTHPMAYQFFIFHSMLVVLGISIYWEMKDSLSIDDYRNTLLLLLIMSAISLYFNSIFAVPEYVDGVLISVENHANFFFTYIPPIPIQLTKVWQWVAYLAVLWLCISSTVTLMYLPVLRRGRREQKNGK